VTEPNPTESQPPRHPDGGSAAQRHLLLVKSGQRWMFRYTPGDEVKLMEELVVLADDPESDLDWFDAAVLSHQMGQCLLHQFNGMLKCQAR